MSAPPPPHFFRSPSFASSNEPTFLSENLTYNEQPIHMSCPEFSPLKKPRNTPCDSFSNQNSNPTMPPNIQYSFPNQNSNPTNPPPNPPSSFSNQIPNSVMPPPNPPPPRGLTKMFYKTRLCVGFREGTCPHGSNCNFAHGIEDLRKPPPNWKEIVTSHGDDQMGNWDEDKMISRRRLCKRFYNGEECPYGERCNFLHEVPFKFREEPWRYRDRESSVISIVGSHLNSGNVSDQPDGNWNVNTSFHSNAVNQKNSFWKTKICNKWEKTGQCQYGEKCHYAHGQAELKKFGGVNEEETVNAGTTPLKSLPNCLNDISSSETAARASSMQQKLSKKELFMLKRLNQINGIYGDWIDDLAQVGSSPIKEN